MGGLWGKKTVYFQTYKVLEKVKVTWYGMVQAESRNCGFHGPPLAYGYYSIVECTEYAGLYLQSIANVNRNQFCGRIFMQNIPINGY